MTITVTALTANRVYQRRIGGTGRAMALSGTYSGGTPTYVQAKVIAASGGATVVDWTTLTGATIAAGNWSGTLPNVPQGGWYTLQVRWDNTADTASDSNEWCVGMVIWGAGQSNCKGSFVQAGSANGNTLTSIRINDATFGTVGWHKGASFTSKAFPMANELQVHNGGVPVGISWSSVDGSSVQAHVPGASTIWTNIHETYFNAAGGEAEALVWIQGEGGYSDYWYQLTDGYSGRDNNGYVGSLSLVHQAFCDLAGRTKNQMPLVLASINRWTSTYAQTEYYQRQWMASQREIVRCADTLENVWFSHSMVGYEQFDDASYVADGYHWVTASAMTATKLFGRTLASALGYANGTPAWHIVHAKVVDATHTDVMVAHSLGTDFTGTSGTATGLVGFEITGDAGTTWSSATGERVDANTIRLTHASMPDDSNRKIRHMWGNLANEVDDNLVCDNSDYAALLCQTVYPIEVESSTRVATPTFVGALRQNDPTSITWDVGRVGSSDKLVVIMTTSESIAGASLSDVTPNEGVAVTPTLRVSTAAADGRGIKIWTAQIPHNATQITYLDTSNWGYNAVFVLQVDDLASTTPYWTGGGDSSNTAVPVTLTPTVPARGILLGAFLASTPATAVPAYDTSDVSVEICKDWTTGFPVSWFQSSNLSAGSPVIRPTGFGAAKSYIGALVFEAAATDNQLEELPLPAANFGKVAYYEISKPFINLLKNSWNQNDNRTGTDGWHWYTGTYSWTSWDIVAMTGQTLAEFSKARDRLKLGKYIATWTGANEVQLGPGVGNAAYVTVLGLVSPNRYEVVVTDERAMLAWRTRSPGSGTSPGTLNDLAVFHEDEEARYLAGEIFAQDWLDAYSHFRVLRAMDIIGANVLGFDTSLTASASYPSVERSDYCDEDHRSWAAGKLPPSIIGKAGIALGCDIWVSVPVKMSRACMRAFAQEIYDTGFTGLVYCEYGNEIWNFANTSTWLSTVKAAGTDVDGGGVPLTGYGYTGTPAGTGGDRASAGHALGAAQMWYEFEQVFGRSRIKRVIGGQYAWFEHDSAKFYSINPFTGNTIKEDLDIYAVAPYFFIGGGTPAIPLNAPISIWRNKTHNLSGDELFNVFADWAFTNYGPLQAYHETKRLTMFPQGEVHGYEGATDITYPTSYNQFIGCDKTTIHTDDTSVNITGTQSAYVSGERIVFARRAWTAVDWTQVQETPSSSIVGGTWYYFRKHSVSGGNCKLWIYPSLAAYNADTTPNGTGAIAMDTNGVGYRYFTKDWAHRGTLCWGDVANNALDFGIDITDMWDDGDELMSRSNQGEFFEGGVEPDAVWVGSTRYPVRLFGTTKLKVYANWTDYATDTPLPVTNANSTFWFDNITRVVKFRLWVDQHLMGKVGKDVYEFMTHNLYKGYQKTFNHYTGSGESWGLRQDEYSTPPARALYLYGLDTGAVDPEPEPEPQPEVPEPSGGDDAPHHHGNPHEGFNYERWKKKQINWQVQLKTAVAEIPEKKALIAELAEDLKVKPNAVMEVDWSDLNERSVQMALKAYAKWADDEDDDEFLLLQ